MTDYMAEFNAEAEANRQKANIERCAANWREIERFTSDVCEDAETKLRIGAEHMLLITANDDGTFTMKVVAG